MSGHLGPIKRLAAGSRSWRWRGLYVAGVALAITGLVTGLASAALNATGGGTGSASTGSVTMNVNSAASRTCGYGSLLPGDLTGSGSCALAVSYTGTLAAFMSLTVQIQARAGSGSAPLYDGTNAGGLTLSVGDGHNSFTVPTGPGTSGGSCPPGFTCWTAANDLAAWYGSDGAPNLTFAGGASVTFTVTPSFPRTTGNPYQGGTATVTLTAQAVQAPANPLPSGCTTATIGRPCPASGTFSWS
jgi:hypothetical protein